MKAAFQKLNEPIVPGKDLQDRVFEKIEHKRVARLRPLTAVAAVLAVVLLATPVMASEAIQDLMYQVSPELFSRPHLSFPAQQYQDTLLLQEGHHKGFENWLD